MKFFSAKPSADMIGDDATYVTREEFERYKAAEKKAGTKRFVLGAVFSNLVGIGVAGTTIGIVGWKLSKGRK